MVSVEELLQKHQSKRCPACGASKGRMCRGLYGQTLKKAHAERIATVHSSGFTSLRLMNSSESFVS